MLIHVEETPSGIFTNSELSIPGRKPVGPVEINCFHPLARGLQGCWILNENSGRPVNLVSNRPAEVLGAPVWSIGSVRFPNDGDGFLDSSEKLDFIESLTMIVRFKMPAADNVFWHLAGLRANAGNYQAQIRVNTAEQLSYLASSGAINFTTPLTSGQIYTSGVSHTSGEVAKIYNDGLLVLTGASAQTITDYDVNFTFGCLDGDGLQPFTDELYFVMAWDRELTALEHAEINRDPYQFLKPKAPQRIHLESADGFHLPDARFEMPELFIPNNKPGGPVEIDWQNPITQNLISCVPFIDDVVDLTGHLNLSITDSSTFLHVDGQKMVRQEYQTTDVDTLVTADLGDLVFGDSLFTVLSIVIPRQQAITRDAMTLGKWEGGRNNNNEWALGRNYSFFNTDYTPNFAVNIGQTEYFAPNADPLRDFRVDYPLFHLGVRRNSTLIENWDDADGNLVKATETTASGPVITSATRKFTIGTFPTNGNFNCAQDVLFFAAWDRPLTEPEIRSLYKNPYQFLAPK